ncbi:sugar kinase [Leifsonia sp. H3M29-4]|uniref:sugar kinase n=1 Tax=Salinibacterium metalliresistens TaxID=3031321 RepID=UPI0023DCCA29|nr:sugar kinase [Salinibacterium metalliresistens]MDF1478147.1 sugar kinase [Salinibacterium metalliresistens]
MMTSLEHLVTVGETMGAVVPDPVGPFEAAQAFRVLTAGAESNVAACAVQLGLSSSWASRLGDDPAGRRVLATIAGYGVDVSRVELTSGAPTGLLLKDPGPDATRVHYYRSGSAASRLSLADLDGLLADLPAATALHTSGVTAALSESCAALVDRIVVGRATGAALVSIDVNHRPALWGGRSAPAELHRLADASDVCFVGLDEASALWGSATPEAVRQTLPNPRLLVVKDGAVGATVFEGDRRIRVAALATLVREPVGAGDAFAGGFLAAYARSGDSRFAARVGHVSAGAVLRSSDDVATQPSLESLEELLALSDSQWTEWAQTPPSRGEAL